MAQWGTKSKAGKAPSRGQGSQTAGAWQESRPGRAAVTPEAIAKRAYEKWLTRGGRHGADQQDWFEAERELWAKAGRSEN